MKPIQFEARMLIGLNRALGELAEQKTIPNKLSYWLMRISREVVKEIETFEQARMKIIDKYADKDEDGQYRTENDQYVIPDQAGYAAEFEEIAANPIEIRFNKVKVNLDELDKRGVEISPESYFYLDLIFDIEEETEAAEEAEEDSPVQILEMKKD